ncbi:aromatic ring-hydroxylating dioxygenase subunit alpha [Marinobacter sp. X15-166B]|uniref:aromatic ring-hydroxylating dioxygenase subunit alpha n=1 Tax=Marinobacter sp. X15-166B TaxID=1897620 RepID=UPI00085C55BC|nr:aromatic ring-hydroxylating dioxygenase subunit alpha [Marinobacter sp. X15-166B]OEY65946.1 vanillate O-demethylase oxygenase [Marinobacter sp. X15-166B]
MSNYVLNTWYPLTWSRDVRHELSSHRIVEQDIVVYRTSTGDVVAMEDLCPHRFLPLSMGRLKGDTVECGYHGVTFDCSGKCVRVPGQDMVPPKARVVTYPTHENMGLVWIWMGDPELADTSKVFDLPQYHDADWSVAEGDALRIETNYLSLADNLCDPAHVNFVHLSTLGNAAGEDVKVQFEVEEEKIVTWRWINDAPPIPLFEKFGNFKGNVDRWHYYHYYAPSIAIIDFGSADTGTGAPEGRRDNCIQIYACHFMTPVDERTTIDHWLHVKNFHADDEMNTALSNEFRVAFAEDKAILEAVQKKEEQFEGRKKLKIAIDAAPIRMRMMIEKMKKAEQTNPA